MDMLQPADDRSPGAEHTGDGKLSNLLDSLSGQVSGAFSQLTQLHRELCAKQQATTDLESELEMRADQLSQDRAELMKLRHSAEAASAELAERGVELARRSEVTSRMESELDSRAAQLTRDHMELEEMRAAADAMAAELAARGEEIARRSEDVSRAERELAQREENLAQDRSELEQLRASLDRRSAEIDAADREVGERSERVTVEAQRLAELAEDVEYRSSLLVAREQAVDGFHGLLGRMRDAIVAPTVEEITEAAAVVATTPEPEPAPFEADPSWQAVVSDAGSTSEPTREPEERVVNDSDHAATVDLADFSEEELATFSVRRRLRAYSDEFLAAEIRAERGGKSKKKRWF